MRIVMYLLLSQCLFDTVVHAAETNRDVKIADPYIELRTGAGTGYPVFLVVERGATVTLLRRKTDWFKVRTAAGDEGWVALEQLEQTLTPSGEKTRIATVEIGDYQRHQWQIGASGGDYGGARTLSLFGGYRFADHLSGELTFSQAVGNYSSSLSAKLGLLAHLFPDWRVAPFFALGTGVVRIEPDTTLVQATDRSESFAAVGIGAQAYVTRRFVVRAEFNDYLIFSADNTHDANEELHEWKAGFAVFF